MNEEKVNNKKWMTQVSIITYPFLMRENQKNWSCYIISRFSLQSVITTKYAVLEVLLARGIPGTSLLLAAILNVWLYFISSCRLRLTPQLVWRKTRSNENNVKLSYQPFVQCVLFDEVVYCRNHNKHTCAYGRKHGAIWIINQCACVLVRALRVGACSRECARKCVRAC